MAVKKKTTQKKPAPVAPALEEVRDLEPQEALPEHDDLVILRAPREGDVSIWRSSNGFVSVSKENQHLTFPGSEVYVKSRPGDMQVAWDIVGPVKREQPTD